MKTSSIVILACLALASLPFGVVALKSSPAPKPAPKSSAPPVDNLKPVATEFVPGGPAPAPFSPRGWLIQTTGPTVFSTYIPRLVEPKYVMNPDGSVGWVLADVPGAFGQQTGGMVGSTHFGDNGFASPSLNPAKSTIEVMPGGPCAVRCPGVSGFGTAPLNPLASFTLTNSGGTVQVTPVP